MVILDDYYTTGNDAKEEKMMDIDVNAGLAGILSVEDEVEATVSFSVFVCV